MTTFIRFNDALIDIKKLLWVGLNTTPTNCILVFRFENQANDLIFNYPDLNTGRTELYKVEALIRNSNSALSLMHI